MRYFIYNYQRSFFTESYEKYFEQFILFLTVTLTYVFIFLLQFYVYCVLKFGLGFKYQKHFNLAKTFVLTVSLVDRGKKGGVKNIMSFELTYSTGCGTPMNAVPSVPRYLNRALSEIKTFLEHNFLEQVKYFFFQPLYYLKGKSVMLICNLKNDSDQIMTY